MVAEVNEFLAWAENAGFNPWEAWRAEKARADRAEGYVEALKAELLRAEEQLRLCNVDQLDAETRITAALERIEAYQIDPVALDVRAILRGEE
jgi:hypothetical protein